MKIIQTVTNLSYGDAIGNDVLALHDMLRGAGYDAGIMALTIHERLTGMASGVDFSRVAPEDLVIFHKATGDPFPGYAKRLNCRKALIYHNITPPKYFLAYDEVMAWNLWLGRRQLRKLAKCVDYGWGDSRYNCRELIAAGFPQDRVDVLPIPFEPRGIRTNRTSAGTRGTKLLFIGRVAPNKKHEDLIKLYCHCLREDPDATLTLVGSWAGFDKYYAKLKGFAADLGLTDGQVVFTGHVTEAEKQAYLAGADVFVCMSEHEGFCVPLLEAMDCDLPIVAYAACAVPETLGDNGLLFREKDYAAMAGQIRRLRADAAFRDSVIARQRENLKRFDVSATRTRLLSLVERALGNGGGPA